MNERECDKEARFIVDVARTYALSHLHNAAEVGHIDNLPGARVYVRDANSIIRVLGNRRGKLLDWGCGFGQMAWLLANRGFHVHACDWAARPRIAELLDQRINYFALCSPSLIPVADETYDVVLSSGTLEHAQNILESMREIRRILKPNGWFIIFRFPAERSLSEIIARWSGRWSHAIRMSKSELIFLMRIFSFRVVRSGYDSFLPIFLASHFRSLRGLREKLDVPITVLDSFFTKVPLLSSLSTSMYCFAHVNDEYLNVVNPDGTNPQ